MMKLTETALSAFNAASLGSSGNILASLTDVVRRILPHQRYLSFREALTVGHHPNPPPTPLLPTEREVRRDDAAMDHSISPCTPMGPGGLGHEIRNPPPSPDDIVFRPLYQAQGKFAWMNGKRIENVKTLMWLGAGIMSSAHIKSGTVKERRGDANEVVEVKYICKTWEMSTMGDWEGFYSELALYKSSRYLRPLQGDVVPRIMGIYTRPGKVDIAMELPHPVFWMEASASIPLVLKARVVEAFRKLHERGVVHGDVALRHILIGADARITLIDFQASRADIPNKEVGLEAASPGEKELEMRRVKFLLDFEGARSREFRRSHGARVRTDWNRIKAKEREELLRHGITIGLPADQPEWPEDTRTPPVPYDELKSFWMENANDEPRHFVVPGSSETAIVGAITSLAQCIREMESLDSGWSTCGSAASSPRSPLSPRLPPSPPLPAGSLLLAPYKPPAHGVPDLQLPSSIKARDFAYEYPQQPSISGTQTQPSNSSAPASLPTRAGSPPNRDFDAAPSLPSKRRRDDGTDNAQDRPRAEKKARICSPTRRADGDDDHLQTSSEPSCPRLASRSQEVTGKEGGSSVTGPSFTSTCDGGSRADQGHPSRTSDSSSGPETTVAAAASLKRSRTGENFDGSGLHGRRKRVRVSDSHKTSLPSSSRASG
ncbi:hypothetical protein BC834DRAFT_5389 [Gloeopeniophorella convolvens]|nr:hypothetical protein BC834DRAFT_5389 [Gloeopeniophorella convolvens]